jgi:hypothetical protein
MRDGTSIALREVLVHMIEEYARRVVQLLDRRGWAQGVGRG